MANFEFIVGFIVNYFYFFVIKLNAMEVLVKLYGYFDHRYWRFWVSVASRLRNVFHLKLIFLVTCICLVWLDLSGRQLNRKDEQWDSLFGLIVKLNWSRSELTLSVSLNDLLKNESEAKLSYHFVSRLILWLVTIFTRISYGKVWMRLWNRIYWIFIVHWRATTVAYGETNQFAHLVHWLKTASSIDWKLHFSQLINIY